MRVVVNGPMLEAQPTGPGIYLQALLRAMLEERADLEIVARHMSIRSAPEARAAAARIDARIRPLTTPLPATLLRRLQAIGRFPSERLLLGDFDVYHQFHTDADPAVPGNRLVVTLHDTVALEWPEAEGEFYRHAGRLLRRSAAVITGSEFSKTCICTAFELDSSRVYVVGCGLDHQRFRPHDPESPRWTQSELDVDGPYLLYVGGHTPRKNVSRLISAFAAVRRDALGSRLRLVLAGPVGAMEQTLRREAPADIHQEALIFSGYVPDGDLPALYQRATALLYPSLYEGFGMPVVEAMACGTPVVTSDGSATKEIAGDAALLVHPADTQSIIEGILQLLHEGSAAAAARRQRGIRRAAQFNWESTARAVLAVYDAVVSAELL